MYINSIFVRFFLKKKKKIIKIIIHKLILYI